MEPCRDVEGIASSKILPLRVVSCNGRKKMRQILNGIVSIRWFSAQALSYCCQKSVPGG